MILRKAALALATSCALIFAGVVTAFAQTDPSSSPSVSPSPSTDPSASPSPSPTNTPSPSETPSSSSAAAGGTTKQEVLGETTTLGETSNNKEIAKWVIALGVGLLAFLIGLKIARSKAEE